MQLEKTNDPIPKYWTLNQYCIECRLDFLVLTAGHKHKRKLSFIVVFQEVKILCCKSLDRADRYTNAN